MARIKFAVAQVALMIGCTSVGIVASYYLNAWSQIEFTSGAKHA